jgi:two-component system cell cycle response regulator
MSNPGTHESSLTPADARVDDSTPVTDRPPSRAEPSVDGHTPTQLNTPLLPASLPREGTARATLTVLTGLDAGRLMAVDGDHLTIGRAADADLVVDEPGVSRHHARIARAPGGGFYVEDLGSTNGTFVGTVRVGVSLLHQVDVLQLGPSLKVRFALVDPAEESLSRYLYEAAIHDPLTHAYNRQYLADRMVAEVARARRADADVAVLMIDVDALKTVNDRFGHLAGDRVLSTIASRILRALRVEDVFARYGGDEFVVLAVGTDHSDAIRLAERVRRAVEGLRMSARGCEVAITISIGVASLAEVAETDEPGGALLTMADARMYEAKGSGGNRVCATGSGPDPKRAETSPRHPTSQAVPTGSQSCESEGDHLSAGPL